MTSVFVTFGQAVVGVHWSYYPSSFELTLGKAATRILKEQLPGHKWR